MAQSKTTKIRNQTSSGGGSRSSSVKKAADKVVNKVARGVASVRSRASLPVIRQAVSKLKSSSITRGRRKAA